MTGFDPETDLGMTRAPLPIQGNVKVGGSTLTAATIAGVGGIAFDGHFVAQKDAAIRARVEMFVDTLVHAAVARVPE
jgi:hypothetical protein